MPTPRKPIEGASEETTYYALRLPARLRAAIRDLADQDGRSENKEMVWLLQDAVNRRQAEGGARA